jgi:hypothetical protein
MRTEAHKESVESVKSETNIVEVPDPIAVS